MSMNDVPTLQEWANKTDKAVPGFDLEPQKYMSRLEGLDITEAQKTELLETLWSIMRSFVELGFRVDVCGQLFETFAIAASAESADGTLLPSSDMNEEAAHD